MRIHPGLSFVPSWCGLRVLPTFEVRDAPAAVGLLCQREGPGEFGREAHMCRVAIVVLDPGNPAANIDTRNASVFGHSGAGWCNERLLEFAAAVREAGPTVAFNPGHESCRTLVAHA